MLDFETFVRKYNKAKNQEPRYQDTHDRLGTWMENKAPYTLEQYEALYAAYQKWYSEQHAA